MSRVGVLARLHNAVGNLVTYIWLRQSFVAISFERCRYFLAHVACRNLPWQGLDILFSHGERFKFFSHPRATVLFILGPLLYLPE